MTNQTQYLPTSTNLLDTYLLLCIISLVYLYFMYFELLIECLWACFKEHPRSILRTFYTRKATTNQFKHQLSTSLNTDLLNTTQCMFNLRK